MTPYDPNIQTGEYFSPIPPAPQQGTVRNDYSAPAAPGVRNYVPGEMYPENSPYAPTSQPRLANYPVAEPKLPPLAIGWKPKKNENDPLEVQEPDYGSDWFNAWLRKSVSTLTDPKYYRTNLSDKEITTITEGNKKNVNEFVKKYPWLASAEDYLAAIVTVGGVALSEYQKPVQTPEEKELGKAGTVKPTFAHSAARIMGLGMGLVKATVANAFQTVLSALVVGEQPFRVSFATSMAQTEVEQRMGMLTYVDEAEEKWKSILPDKADYLATGLARMSASGVPWNTFVRRARMAYTFFEQGDIANAALYGTFAVPAALMPIAPVIEDIISPANVAYLGGRAMQEINEHIKPVNLDPSSPLKAELNAETALAVAGSQALYTFAIDHLRYQEYVKAVKSGVRPDFAAEHYMNPWIEMGGGMVFDILNVIGGSPTDLLKTGNAVGEFMKPTTETVKALNDARKVAEAGADATTSMKTAHKMLVDIWRKDMKDYMTRLVEWGDNYLGIVPTADAKAIYVTRRVNTFLELVTNLGKQHNHANEIAESMSALIKIAIGDDDEALAAMSVLVDQPFGAIFHSRAAKETAMFFREILTDANGKVSTKSISGFLEIIAKNKNKPAVLTEILGKKMNKAIEKLYPTMDKMEEAAKAVKSGVVDPKDKYIHALAKRYENIPFYMRGINKVERAVIKPFYRMFNSFFALVYMGLSPGYAVRNVLSNTISYVADMSWGAVGEKIPQGIGEAITAQLPDMFGVGMVTNRKTNWIVQQYGFLPDFVKQGIGLAGGEETLMKKMALFSKLASMAESGLSVQIVYKALQRELSTFMRRGGLPSVDMMVEAGMSESVAKKFFQLTVDNWGNSKKATQALLGDAAVSKEIRSITIDVWRHTELPKKFIGYLEENGLYEEFLRLRQTATSREEFVDGFYGIWKNIKKLGGLAVGEYPDLPKNAPEVEILAKEHWILHDMKLGEKQIESSEIFQQMVVSYRAARSKIAGVANPFLSHLRTLYPDMLFGDAGKTWDDIYHQLDILNSEVRLAQTQNILDNALETVKTTRKAIFSKDADLKSIWKNFQFTTVATGKTTTTITLGDMPENLTKDMVKNAIWDAWRKARSEAWEAANYEHQKDWWNTIGMVIGSVKTKTGQEPLLTQNEVDAFVEAMGAFSEGHSLRDSVNWEEAKRAVRMISPEDLPDMWFKEGVTAETATLKDLHPFYLKLFGWDRGTKQLMGAVNFDRGLYGLDPYTDPYKMPFTEVIDALRRRVVQKDDLETATMSRMQALSSHLRNLPEVERRLVINYTYRNSNTKERRALKTLLMDLGEAERGNMNPLDPETPVNIGDLWSDLEKLCAEITTRLQDNVLEQNKKAAKSVLDEWEAAGKIPPPGKPKDLIERKLDIENKLKSETPKPVKPVTISISKSQAKEIDHKLSVLADDVDLQSDYGLTSEQADELRRSIPFGGGSWTVPDFGIDAVADELEDAAMVLRDAIATGERSEGDVGRSLSTSKVAKSLEELSRKLREMKGDLASEIEGRLGQVTKGVIPPAIREERDLIESAIASGMHTDEEVQELIKRAKEIDDTYMPAEFILKEQQTAEKAVSAVDIPGLTEEAEALREAIRTGNIDTLRPDWKEKILQMIRQGDIPEEQARKWLEEFEMTLDEAYAKFYRDDTLPPSMARQALMSWKDFSRDARTVLTDISDAWGQTEKQVVDQNLREAIGKWSGIVDNNMIEAKTRAMVIARETRDFALHPYWDRTYADLALAHIYPYQYWYSRTYMNWAQRLVNNPKVAAGYAKYRRALERAHAGTPEWWKYQMSTRDLPGVNEGDGLYDNPLYYNLEAAFNPVNGLTGIDFTDANKRVNWYTNMLDDMGKYGASMFTPINWLVAACLWSESEKAFAEGRIETGSKYTDASQRWIGRLFPQSASIKTFLGYFDKQVPWWGGYEVDPFVRGFMGGFDPYERRRLTRYLAGMTQYTEEQRLDAAYNQSGKVWDEAVRGALSERAGGQAMSLFFGVGFKPRTTQDMEVDAFYNEYFSLLGMSSGMTPVEYQGAMEGLRNKYPFMDTVLLGRKSDYFRDAAFAYTVLARVPPGHMDEVANAVQVPPALIDKFYKDKGRFTGWNKSDASRFMAAIVDISMTLEIPAYSTKMDWLGAKQKYYDMRDAVTAQFGSDIWDKVDLYYELLGKKTNSLDKTPDYYLENFPEVAAALDMNTAIVMSDPQLAKYYGSFSKAERYYSSMMYSALDAKFPTGSEMWRQYYEMALMDAVTGGKTANAFKKKNKKVMDAYIDEKNVWKDLLNRQLEEYASFMDKPELGIIRSDFEPTNTTQEAVANVVNPPPGFTWEQYSVNIPAPLQRLVVDYWVSGKELKYATQNELDYLAGNFGFESGDDLLVDMGRALRDAQALGGGNGAQYQPNAQGGGYFGAPQP